MLQKGCECRERKMEGWKQNGDKVFLDEVRGERAREEKKRGKRKNEMS
jgi:hypothetical protein